MIAAQAGSYKSLNNYGLFDRDKQNLE